MTKLISVKLFTSCDVVVRVANDFETSLCRLWPQPLFSQYYYCCGITQTDSKDVTQWLSMVGKAL